MVALKEITWEEASAPGFETSTRQAWRAAVAEIAVKAKQTLPDCAGRVESAVKIVLAGDVELLAYGKAQVASQSNGQTVYHLVNGTCDCHTRKGQRSLPLQRHLSVLTKSAHVESRFCVAVDKGKRPWLHP